MFLSNKYIFCVTMQMVGFFSEIVNYLNYLLKYLDNIEAFLLG